MTSSLPPSLAPSLFPSQAVRALAPTTWEGTATCRPVVFSASPGAGHLCKIEQATLVTGPQVGSHLVEGVHKAVTRVAESHPATAECKLSLCPQHSKNTLQRYSLPSRSLLPTELAPGHPWSVSGKQEPRGRGQAWKSETAMERAKG